MILNLKSSFEEELDCSRMASLLPERILSTLHSHGYLFRTLPTNSSSEEWRDIRTKCGFTSQESILLSRYRCEHKVFCVDIDGTIVFRRPKPMSVADRISQLTAHRLTYINSDENFSEGDTFEGRQLLFKFSEGLMRETFIITFRKGTYLLLKGLSNLGTVYLVTHGCETYAHEIAKFLNKVVRAANTIQYESVAKPALKYLPLAASGLSLFVLDDKPQRWVNQSYVTHRISSFIGNSNDMILYTILCRHVDVFYKFNPTLFEYFGHMCSFRGRALTNGSREVFDILLVLDIALNSGILPRDKYPLGRCRSSCGYLVPVDPLYRCSNCQQRYSEQSL